MNVLISLYKGYGLGDAVQMSAVLRHVVAARPHWRIHYQAEEGKHQVGRDIVHDTFAYGSGPPTHYDAEVQIILYDTWANWGDRPNTRVSSCLHERFDLPWVPELGRYQVKVDDESLLAVQTLLWRDMTDSVRTIKPNFRPMSMRYVAVHYEGDSSPNRKNLTHAQAGRVCQIIEEYGYVPLILDWRCKSTLPFRKLRVPRDWGSDAEMVCALISQCNAFVGIDSGPGKCASATDTPALIVWTGHHPAPFHDPAPNTTHLVPVGYHGLQPVCNDAGVIKWFEDNYIVRHYERDPVHEINRWLAGVL